MLRCVVYEDEDLLVVNKPAGLNTHAPSPYAGEGIYDFLRHREARWAKLAIIQRLDKETSGVMVFAKTTAANRSLTEQFTRRTVRKKYVLVTDRSAPEKELRVKSTLARAGEKYVTRPAHSGGEEAETVFRVIAEKCRALPGRGYNMVEAEPLTGRTHQIRVHAAESGFPILGDTLYGGTRAARVCLHAAELTLKHPSTGRETTFHAPADFEEDARWSLRAAVVEADLTNAYRVVHGASDGWPGWYVERLGDYLLSSGERALAEAQREELTRWTERFAARGVYHRISTRRAGREREESSPQLALGEPAPERFRVRENGVEFELSFGEGAAVGLFLDQRENRRRLLTGHVAAGFELAGGGDPLDVLNTFAYTCGFSVCAARAGARTTSVDLSKKYLEWGRRNFALNGLDAAGHEFIRGDVFDWLRRLAKKSRTFDVVLLDPPTFSRSKESGAFQAEKDYGKLVSAALRVLKEEGVLFASTNAAEWAPEAFLDTVERAVRTAKREVVQRHYLPQPPDFPISRGEPAYLKTVWMRIH